MNTKSYGIGHCVKRIFLTVFLLGSLIGLSSVTAAQTGEPSREPVLRIETGMHTASIWQIGVDAANRFLVTASEDKTVRVWELPSMRLLRVIRVPIGAGNEGKLYAVAISPDGSTIAAGGRTGYDWEKAYSIYVFERDSGRLIRRLGGLPERVLNLVYSPDGRYLAATLGGKDGVRVFSTTNYELIGQDKEYDGESDLADFARTGKLATTSRDGFIRLYQVGENVPLRLLIKRKVAGRGIPEAISFSPDGSKIATASYDPSKEDAVDVLSASDLSPMYAPKAAGIKSGDVSTLDWSDDGNTLYAGGRIGRPTKYTLVGKPPVHLIRAWADGGRGQFADFPTSARGSIRQINALHNGDVVYGTSEPEIGLMDAGGAKKVFLASPLAEYFPGTRPWSIGKLIASKPHYLLTSADGNGIWFPFEFPPGARATFSVKDRVLDASAPLDKNVPSELGLRGPKLDAQGLDVSNWEFKVEPKLNGRPLPLDTSETSTVLAIAPDEKRFVIGSYSHLRLFDNSGTELWNVVVPALTRSVNISGNGKVALAAFADGTIRWYRITDGKELLAFFPSADRKRWVLWTPSGYYDASPGAEELIGWHVNNGKDQAADFFPVGQFRSTYYRPDVISKVLETGDEARALELANEELGRKAQITTVAQMLPPVVEIASPSDNSEISSSEVTIRYSLRTTLGEAVTHIRILVDGRPVTGNRQLTREEAAASGVRELKLSVPERDSEVSIIAENKFAASVPATIRLRWHGATPSADTFVIQPKLYVLAIGVSQYQNPSYSLKFAAKDAQDFAAAATIQKGLLYRDVVVKVLTDQHATKDEILDGLDWIRKETTSKDVAMVFFAGHGLNDQNGVYYFLPYNTDLEKLLRTGVPFTDIKNTVQSLAGKTLFFIDTCHSGNVLGGRRGLADDLNGVINELASAESGAVVFAASTGNQYSLEDEKWNNGAFTKALVEGFTGRADYSGKGRITINMLDLYISERVKELTGGKQTPTTAKPNTVPDFPIAVKR